LKKTITNLFFFVLFFLSLPGFAEKILLTNDPVILIPEENYYRFPPNYSPSHSYHFINISGENRVCFIAEQEELGSLDLLRIYIVQYDKKFLFYCYRYNPNFFEIDF